MKERKLFNKRDAEEVMNLVAHCLPSNHEWEVRLSADSEYFKLYRDGQPFLDDSACDDAYSVDGMAGWIESNFLD